LRQGLLAQRTLRFMDWFGNHQHGVALPYHYLSPGEWRAAFAAAGLDVREWSEHAGLYPWPASLLFDRRLHLVAKLTPQA
ncbi:MAG TPA: hypothetical protein VET66_08410, partial [Steroidobacteraceae bacterium]|nr:hypothetical protein [Steroidobacteraceae bacterium]